MIAQQAYCCPAGLGPLAEARNRKKTPTLILSCLKNKSVNIIAPKKIKILIFYPWKFSSRFPTPRNVAGGRVAKFCNQLAREMILGVMPETIFFIKLNNQLRQRKVQIHSTEYDMSCFCTNEAVSKFDF